MPARAWQARAPLLVVANACALLALAIGAFVLGAWLLRDQVQAAGSLLWLMKANTALCVVATSAATLLLASPSRDGHAWPRRALALLVGAVALATLIEYATGAQLGIDEMLASDAASSFPGLTPP